MKIICILGPTGVGKTKLSLSLAKYYNADILNADSTQVYKGLDIATAKVKDKEGISHYLMDIKNIDEDYTVFDFQKDGRVILDDHIKNNKNIIIVGGTGLYIKALLYDYKFDVENNKNDYDKYTSEELYNKIIKKDPNITIDKNNKRRLIRALNYIENNNKPYSEKEKTDTLLYDTIFVGLTTDRDNLYNIINKRVDLMFEEGLEEEAYNLYKKNIKTKAVLTPIGYKELFEYFDKKITKEEAIELIKQRSRHYAKRQYTWFNNKMDVNWFNTNYDNFDITLNEVINFIDNKQN